MIRVLALCTAVVASGCASSGWHEMKTAHLTGYSEFPGNFRETMKQLEYTRSTLAAFFPRADVGPIEVLFLDGPTMAEVYGRYRGGFVVPAVPGAGSIGRNNLIVMSAFGLDGSALLMTHLYLYKVLPNAPLWFHESLAEYLAMIQVQSGTAGWRACLGFPGVMTKHMRMPLDRFFAITWQQYPESDPAWYQDTGFLLMDYIFHRDHGAYFKQFPAIIDAVSQGTPGPAIMSKVFPGLTLAQLSERVGDTTARHADVVQRNIRCVLPMPIAPDQVPDEAEPRETPIASTEIDRLRAALDRLPRGQWVPQWYPPEVLTRQ